MGGKICILLVEDDPSSRAALVAALEDSGLAVRSCASGEAALGELERLRPDALVTDWRMGQVGGRDVLRFALRLYPDLRVIVITADDCAATRAEAQDHGAYALLPKPIDLDQLDALLTSAIAA